jgi:hypothetical protein
LRAYPGDGGHFGGTKPTGKKAVITESSVDLRTL